MLFGWLPLLGTVLTYLAYLAVIKWRYKGGWITAAGIALIKWRYKGGWITAAGIALIGWLAASLVLSLLAAVGLGGFSALGIPGT